MNGGVITPTMFGPSTVCNEAAKGPNGLDKSIALAVEFIALHVLNLNLFSIYYSFENKVTSILFVCVCLFTNMHKCIMLSIV